MYLFDSINFIQCHRLKDESGFILITLCLNRKVFCLSD